MTTTAYAALLPFELTEEITATLKLKYEKIFAIPVAGVEFIIRPLFKEDWIIINEYTSTNPKLTVADVDDKIVDLALIGPRPDYTKGGWAALPAGIASTLAAYIKSKSGFIVDELKDTMYIRTINLAEKEPDIPSKEVIAKLKAENNVDSLSMITINDDAFIVRPITRVEWRQAISNAQSAGDDANYARDLEVCKNVVLYPRKIDWDKKPLGCTETITDFVISVSGYTVTSEVREL